MHVALIHHVTQVVLNHSHPAGINAGVMNSSFKDDL